MCLLADVPGLQLFPNCQREQGMVLEIFHWKRRNHRRCLIAWKIIIFSNTVYENLFQLTSHSLSLSVKGVLKNTQFRPLNVFSVKHVRFFFVKSYLRLLWSTSADLLWNTETLKRVAPHSDGSLNTEKCKKIKTNPMGRPGFNLTLKFSINPPLPSVVPRVLSVDARADMDGSPIMHLERVDNSACRFSRSEQRVRSCAGENCLDVVCK